MKTIQPFLTLLITCLLILTSCAKDPCESLLCMNNGTCSDDGCLCPEKYTGSNCAEQVTPDKIRIRTIQLTKFPGMNANVQWDENNGPDIYFRIYEGDQPLAQPILAFHDADPTQDYYFFIDVIDLRNTLKEHRIELRDYDPEDNDDLIGEVTFTPYFTTNGFPSIIVVDNGGEIAFTMEVDYYYKGQVAL